MKWLASWAAALAISFLRLTCRIRVFDDPRDELRRSGTAYVYSILHAHQVAITIGAEPGTGAMVSRSADGEMIVPALRVRGCIPVRGSGGGRKAKQNKGGGTALFALIHHVRGGRPAVLAVDGPNGPRNYVHKGIVTLASETNAVVLNVITIPTRRWILSKTWDRLQIPKPFCTINAYFAEPIEMLPEEAPEHFRQRVEDSLRQLEAQFDPAEGQTVEAQPIAEKASPTNTHAAA